MAKHFCLALLFCFCWMPLLASAASSTEKAGDVIQVLLPSMAYGTTLYLGDEVGEKQMYQAFFTNLGLTYMLKVGVAKARPDGSDNYSFPSGHTSSAFQGASFIHARFGFVYAVPAYLGASFVGYSRVYADKHFSSDVLAGAALGMLSSFYFVTAYKNITVSPMVNNEGYGLVMNGSW